MASQIGDAALYAKVPQRAQSQAVPMRFGSKAPPSVKHREPFGAPLLVERRPQGEQAPQCMQVGGCSAISLATAKHGDLGRGTATGGLPRELVCVAVPDDAPQFLLRVVSAVGTVAPRPAHVEPAEFPLQRPPEPSPTCRG